MITPIETPWEPDLWQQELRQAFRSSRELLKAVGVTCNQALEKPNFPVLVPRGFAARIQANDPDDPLLRQVLATAEENRTVPGFVTDPLEETAEHVSGTAGLLQKYRHRVLLITTTGCAINCRYCFRRHFPYSAHRPAVAQGALEAVAANTEINEVILSGGDPLLLDDIAMANLYQELNQIPHLQRIRIHSRIPVVLPERMTPQLLRTFHNSALPTVLVVHTNHANELNSVTHRALSTLKAQGIWLLNQSVLLKGVNNSVEAQVALAEALFTQGVQPYYLHMPDRVAGTSHFFVTDYEAAKLYQSMQAILPGFLVPKLVREVAGRAHKVQLELSSQTQQDFTY